MSLTSKYNTSNFNNMKENEKLRIQEIIERHDRMYTATIYGSVDGANHQKECDFEELVTLVKNIGVIPCCTGLPTKKDMNIEIHEQFLDWRKTENGLNRKAFILGFKQCYYWFKRFKKQN